MATLSLLSNGYTIITDKQDGVLRAYTGALGGILNNNWEYTKAFPVAPGWTRELEVNEECIVVYADPFFQGFGELLNRYAERLAENELTLRLADINARSLDLLHSSDNATIESARTYFKDLENGKLNNVIGASLNNAFAETNSFARGQNNTNIVQLIELEQYLKASRDMEFGLDANFNMKREAINDAEAGLNEDTILPRIDMIIENVKNGFDRVNEKYNTNITVDLSSAWGMRKKANEAELDILEDTAEEMPEDEGKEVEENEENTVRDVSELEGDE